MTEKSESALYEKERKNLFLQQFTNLRVYQPLWNADRIRGFDPLSGQT